MADNIERRALTSAETTQYINMSESWLRQSRMNGSSDAPPFIKIGRSVRYLRDDLDAWLEQRRRRNTLSHRVGALGSADANGNTNLP